MRSKTPNVLVFTGTLTVFLCFTPIPVVMAQAGYFTGNSCDQSSCHDLFSPVPSTNPNTKDTVTMQPMPETCNGCHAHGTQLDTLPGEKQNLLAETRAQQYVVGDMIFIDANGGHERKRDGWFKINLYDEAGNLLDSNTGCLPQDSGCEFPHVMQIDAQMGMSKLYVGWLGYNMNKTGGMAIDSLGNSFGEGTRFIGPDHVEVIIATNTFSVVQPGSGKPSDGDSSGGSGAFGLAMTLFFLSSIIYRRRNSSNNSRKDKIN